MKKKVCLMLLALFIIPIFAILGCGDVSSYPVTVFPSSAVYGYVSGNGTYKEGDVVTLTATAKQNSKVIAWVYQNSVLIENGNGYSIANQTDSSQKVTKSTLTFTMNSSNQGRYTAVFDEQKIMYTKLTSWHMTTNLESESTDYDDPNKQPLLSATMEFSQGSSSSTLSTVYSIEEQEVKENLIYTPENITQVLKLDDSNKCHIKVSSQLSYNGKNMTIPFRADIGFQETIDEVQTTNYSYQINYNDGKYEIIFKFKVPTDKYIYLILNYENLK